MLTDRHARSSRRPGPLHPPAPTARAAHPAARSGRAARLLAGTVGAALALAGCVAPKVQTTDEPAPVLSERPDSDRDAVLEELYSQDVAWSACGELECAVVRAPLDWEAPEDGSIQLAVQRSVATGGEDQRIGSLLINPGGPGASGVEFLSYTVAEVFGEDVLAAYDIVGFDPRGVGGSSAVDCGSDATIDEFYTVDRPLASQGDVDAALEAVREFGAACLESTGPLLGEVDTVSAAKDMDLLRAVLGDDALNYVGFSYGTFLGATYAELFPETVGRMVLDGAVDPAITLDELVIGQTIGFEAALRAYVADCQAVSTCPLTGGVDEGMQQIADLLDRIEADPLDAGDGNVVNRTLAYYGIIVTLYDDASWSYLTVALAEAIEQNSGATLLELANYYLDRTPDGQYLSNQMVAFSAINCLDYPGEVRTYDEMVAFADELALSAPTFGRDFAMAVGCETWPFPATGERGPLAAAGAPPILVIGTTGDPATPYEWSVSMAEQLESGVLISYKGEGHTAYGRSNDCVHDAVDDYLVRGTVPQDGLSC